MKYRWQEFRNPRTFSSAERTCVLSNFTPDGASSTAFATCGKLTAKFATKWRLFNAYLGQLMKQKIRARVRVSTCPHFFPHNMVELRKSSYRSKSKWWDRMGFVPSSSHRSIRSPRVRRTHDQRPLVSGLASYCLRFRVRFWLATCRTSAV